MYKIILVILLFVCAVDVDATVTTDSQIIGSNGSNGWYVSDLAIIFKTQTTQALPASITYWIDNNPPVDINLVNTTQQFNNPSFETSNAMTGIRNWYPSGDTGGVYSQSSVYSNDQNRSAAIASSASEDVHFYYYSNELTPLDLPAESSITIELSVLTYMSDVDEAYFEVWGQDENMLNDQLIDSSNSVTNTNPDWQKLSISTIVPTEKPNIYIKFGVLTKNSVITYWDNLKILTSDNTKTEFTIRTFAEGIRQLNYYSRDLMGNVEGTKTITIKKDTIRPLPWQKMEISPGSCGDCVYISTQIRDYTSGLSVSSGNYRVFASNPNPSWQSWSPINSVVLAANNSAVSDGENEYVKITTNEIDLTTGLQEPKKIQFKINDLAGNTSQSPIYGLIHSAFQTLDGSVYVGGSIVGDASITTINYASADIAASGEISEVTTLHNWQANNYQHEFANIYNLSQIVIQIDQLENQSTIITDLVLPTSSGIYRFATDVKLSEITNLSNFENSSVATIILIDGDFVVDQNINSTPSNHTIFMVKKNVLVDSTVTNINGFFIIEGVFDSDPNALSNVQLVVNGSVIAIEGINFNRFIDENTPGEKFIWQPEYLLDRDLMTLFLGKRYDHTWQEIPY